MPSASPRAPHTISFLCPNFVLIFSQHPNCILTSFSSSKSKLILSTYIPNFHTKLSSNHPRYFLCSMCSEIGCAMVAEFCTVAHDFVFRAIILGPMKFWGHLPFSHVLLIICFISMRPSSPNNFSTSPSAPSSPLAFYPSCP